MGGSLLRAELGRAFETDYRYLAIREPLRQPVLPSLEPRQEELPFPTISFGRVPYKLFGLVSNRGICRATS